MRYVVAFLLAAVVVAVAVLIATRGRAQSRAAGQPPAHAGPAAGAPGVNVPAAQVPPVGPQGGPAAATASAAEKFLAANAKADGVHVTPSGLQYKVLSAGAGESPTAADEVLVNYRGTHLDGTEFDSSVARGRPAQFRVGGVIKGWQEGLQLMKPGARYMLWVPPALGYGESGRPPKIAPNELLIFEVELLTVLKPGAPAQ